MFEEDFKRIRDSFDSSDSTVLLIFDSEGNKVSPSKIIDEKPVG